MSDNYIAGRARYLCSAEGLVRDKDSKEIVIWLGPADLYLLKPALHGYTTVVVTNNELMAGAGPDRRFDIIGVEGEGLLLGWEDIGGGRGFSTASDALAAAGYAVI